MGDVRSGLRGHAALPLRTQTLTSLKSMACSLGPARSRCATAPDPDAHIATVERVVHFQLIQPPVLSRSMLNRAEELRKETTVLAQGWQRARLLRVDSRGRVRFDGAGLVLDSAADFAAEPPGHAVFLGVNTDDRHVWAVRDPQLTGTTGDLRVLGGILDDDSAGILSTALALLNWHDSAGFSAIDGSPARSVNGGWARVSETDGHEEFPRTDPAIICLVHDGGDRALLARRQAWPDRMFSILAGFVEAGESLEQCVVREIREEVGLSVHGVQYLGSQPWPFPRSLMIGFSAIADPHRPLAYTDGEISEARWFTRDDIRTALSVGSRAGSVENAGLLLPGSVSIARGIIESWVAADLGHAISCNRVPQS